MIGPNKSQVGFFNRSAHNVGQNEYMAAIDGWMDWSINIYKCVVTTSKTKDLSWISPQSFQGHSQSLFCFIPGFQGGTTDYCSVLFIVGSGAPVADWTIYSRFY